ncbi:MAG: MgtC/SapB family protein, partial [Rhodanobacteraceae bacterium]
MVGVDVTELVLRLLASVLVCGLIGLNRELRGKPAGMRTHVLVGLGCTLVTITMLWPDLDAARHADALSRVIQGILTGIGFLGAGVILRGDQPRSVHGLT